MQITEGQPKDMLEVQNLVQECIRDMHEQGITHWNDQYPPLNIFVSDIESKTLFVMRHIRKIVGIVVLSVEQDKEYEDIEWKDKEGNYLIIHRLAVHPEWQRKCVASKLLDFAEEYAMKNGFTSIRLDTFSRNVRTLNLFEKRKYERKLGEIYFPENEEPYYCYEIQL